LAAVANADCTILCMPEPVVVEALAALLPAVGPHACIADIASVKTRIAVTLASCERPVCYLGLHPMFGPNREFAGGDMLIVPRGTNAATRALEQEILSWGPNVAYVSAEEHDQLTAYLQVLPHAMLLSFGCALAQWQTRSPGTERTTTPVESTLLDLLNRIVGNGSDTYWPIQAHNPYAADARKKLRNALGDLDTIANAGNESAFTRLISQIAKFVRPDANVRIPDSQFP
jgi:prephenate dehydrogenase